MEDKLHELEKRVTALEIARAGTAEELKAICEKINRVLASIEDIVANFVSTPTCLARNDAVKKDLDGLGGKVRVVMEKFDGHITDHWSKADRMATWLSTALIGAFIIGKIAKIW